MKMQEDYPMPSAPPLQEVTNNPKLLLNLQKDVNMNSQAEQFYDPNHVLLLLEKVKQKYL